MFPAGGAQSLNPPAGGAQSSHGRRWSRSILQRLGIRLLLDRTCTQLTCMMRRSVGITASSLPPACLHPPACFWGRSIFLWSRSILQRLGIGFLPDRTCAHGTLTCIVSYATSLHAIFLRNRSIFTRSCSTSCRAAQQRRSRQWTKYFNPEVSTVFTHSSNGMHEASG